jgi:hypothetical protein
VPLLFREHDVLAALRQQGGNRRAGRTAANDKDIDGGFRGRGRRIRQCRTSDVSLEPSATTLRQSTELGQKAAGGGASATTRGRTAAHGAGPGCAAAMGGARGKPA